MVTDTLAHEAPPLPTLQPQRGFSAYVVSRRSFAAILLAVAAFLVIGHRITASPDTIYDESVYSKAAANVATQGRITWQGEPVFVHPPLYFLTQSAWLRITSSQHADLFGVIDEARIATSGGILSVRSENSRLGSSGSARGVFAGRTSLETSGYATAHDRVTLTITAGASSIVIR